MDEPQIQWQVFLEEKKKGEDTDKRRPSEDRGRDWRDAATSQECPELSEAGRDKEWFSP